MSWWGGLGDVMAAEYGAPPTTEQHNLAPVATFEGSMITACLGVIVDWCPRYPFAVVDDIAERPRPEAYGPALAGGRAAGRPRRYGRLDRYLVVPGIVDVVGSWPERPDGDTVRPAATGVSKWSRTSSLVTPSIVDQAGRITKVGADTPLSKVETRIPSGSVPQ